MPGYGNAPYGAGAAYMEMMGQRTPMRESRGPSGFGAASYGMYGGGYGGGGGGGGRRAPGPAPSTGYGSYGSTPRSSSTYGSSYGSTRRSSGTYGSSYGSTPRSSGMYGSSYGSTPRSSGTYGSSYGSTSRPSSMYDPPSTRDSYRTADILKVHPFHRSWSSYGSNNGSNRDSSFSYDSSRSHQTDYRGRDGWYPKRRAGSDYPPFSADIQLRSVPGGRHSYPPAAGRSRMSFGSR